MILYEKGNNNIFLSSPLLSSSFIFWSKQRDSTVDCALAKAIGPAYGSSTNYLSCKRWSPLRWHARQQSWHRKAVNGKSCFTPQHVPELNHSRPSDEYVILTLISRHEWTSFSRRRRRRRSVASAEQWSRLRFFPHDSTKSRSSQRPSPSFSWSLHLSPFPIGSD